MRIFSHHLLLVIVYVWSCSIVECNVVFPWGRDTFRITGASESSKYNTNFFTLPTSALPGTDVAAFSGYTVQITAGGQSGDTLDTSALPTAGGYAQSYSSGTWMLTVTGSTATTYSDIRTSLYNVRFWTTSKSQSSRTLTYTITYSPTILKQQLVLGVSYYYWAAVSTMTIATGVTYCSGTTLAGAAGVQSPLDSTATATILTSIRMTANVLTDITRTSLVTCGTCTVCCTWSSNPSNYGLSWAASQPADHGSYVIILSAPGTTVDDVDNTAVVKIVCRYPAASMQVLTGTATMYPSTRTRTITVEDTMVLTDSYTMSDITHTLSDTKSMTADETVMVTDTFSRSRRSHTHSPSVEYTDDPPTNTFRTRSSSQDRSTTVTVSRDRTMTFSHTTSYSRTFERKSRSRSQTSELTSTMSQTPSHSISPEFPTWSMSLSDSRSRTSDHSLTRTKTFTETMDLTIYRTKLTKTRKTFTKEKKTLSITPTKSVTDDEFVYSPSSSLTKTFSETIELRSKTMTYTDTISESISILSGTQTKERSISRFTDTIGVTFTRTITDSKSRSFEPASGDRSSSRSPSVERTRTLSLTDDETVKLTTTMSRSFIVITAPQTLDGTILADTEQLPRPVLTFTLQGDLWDTLLAPRSRLGEMVMMSLVPINTTVDNSVYASFLRIAKVSKVTITEDWATLSLEVKADLAFFLSSDVTFGFDVATLSNGTLRKMTPSVRGSPATMTISPPFIMSAAQLASIGTATSAAGILASASPMSATSVQTMMIVASMPCMSPSSKIVVKDTMWLISPMYVAFGSFMGLDEDPSIVIWNLLSVAAFGFLHLTVVKFYHVIKNSTWTNACGALVFPHYMIVVIFIFYQSTCTAALRSVVYPETRAFGITGLFILCAVIPLYIILILVDLPRFHPLWRDTVLPPDTWRFKQFFTPRGRWYPRDDAARLSCIFGDFTPPNRCWPVVVLFVYCCISGVASVPRTKASCEAQLSLAMILVLFYGVLIIVRRPHRMEGASVVQGATLVLQSVLPFVNMVIPKSDIAIVEVTTALIWTSIALSLISFVLSIRQVLSDSNEYASSSSNPHLDELNEALKGKKMKEATEESSPDDLLDVDVKNVVGGIQVGPYVEEMSVRELEIGKLERPLLDILGALERSAEVIEKEANENAFSPNNNDTSELNGGGRKHQLSMLLQPGQLQQHQQQQQKPGAYWRNKTAEEVAAEVL